ncbi:hypothetical protein [Streptomyces acidicola]|uniref:hypothetical protein n=1 Tax=Streptomyces acidicola TaxID=2596892 RepID=UPI0034435416
MISRGVPAPGPAGLVEEPAGGLGVVAEGIRDDRGGQFEELLPVGGAAGTGGVQALALSRASSFLLSVGC